MPYVVTGGCIDVLDRSCIKVCPVDCIYEGGRMMYINADECIDCGACEPVCPKEAIYYEDDLPNNLLQFSAAGRSFFDKLGAPGGARKLGKQNHDAGPAAALPK
jgi:ferredoxin